MAVGVVDIADVLFFPDAVGDADDVVDDIDIRVLETAHALAAFRAGVQQLLIRAALRAQRDREIGRHVPRFAQRTHEMAIFGKRRQCSVGLVRRRRFFSCCVAFLRHWISLLL